MVARSTYLAARATLLQGAHVPRSLRARAHRAARDRGRLAQPPGRRRARGRRARGVSGRATDAASRRAGRQGRARRRRGAGARGRPYRRDAARLAARSARRRARQRSWRRSPAARRSPATTRSRGALDDCCRIHQAVCWSPAASPPPDRPADLYARCDSTIPRARAPGGWLLLESRMCVGARAPSI